MNSIVTSRNINKPKGIQRYPKLLRNPFGIVREVAEKIQKGLIELQNDRNCKDTFECVSLEEF